MKTKHETPLAMALACLLLSGAAVLAAGLDEAFNPEPPGMYWVDLGADQGPRLPAEPAWPSPRHRSPDETALLLPPPHLSGGGEFGFLAPAPPDDPPPWPEMGPGGLLLDGALYSLDDAPAPELPLGI